MGIVDIVPDLINLIRIDGRGLLEVLNEIPILRAFANATVDILIFVTLVAYLFPKVYKSGGACLADGVKDAIKPSVIQVFSGLMVGAFVYGGQIEVVKAFASELDINVLKIGGALAMVLLGMLTGTQSTPNNAIFSFYGPALLEAGIEPGKAAAAGAQFAAAGQGMPPADLTTFFAAGLVSGVLKEKVDPVKSMFYAAPVWLWITFTGLILLYL